MTKIAFNTSTIDLVPTKTMFAPPVSGKYMVSCEELHYEKTGIFETITNSNRKWFQFWKPKTIQQEILNKIYKPTSCKIMYLEKGVSIEIPLLLEPGRQSVRRIGN